MIPKLLIAKVNNVSRCSGDSGKFPAIGLTVIRNIERQLIQLIIVLTNLIKCFDSFFLNCSLFR